MAILISQKDKASASSEGLVRFATSEEATAGTRSDVAMSPALVKAQLDGILDGAPAALDTLNELAAAINDDASFFSSVQTDINDLQNQINTLAGGDLSGLQDEIDDTQVGAGLGTDGSYTADATTNYITAATSLKNADFRLDAQIKANADAIISMGAGNIQDLQDEVDDTQSSVGLNSDGTLPAYANNNSFAANASIKAAVEGVDAQVALNTTAIASLGSSQAITDLQAELDASQASVGLNSDGTYSAHSGSNYMDSDTSVKGALSSLDSQIKTNEDAIALKADATSLSSVDARLITAEGEIDTLQSEMDAVESDVATNAADIATNVADIATVNAAIDAHEVEHNANVAAVNAIEASVGLNVDGTYSAPVGTNYLGSATSVRNEITRLDTQVKSNEDDITTNTGDIATLQSDVSTNTTNIATNTSGVSGLDARLTTAEGEIDTLQTEMDSVEADVATNTASISTNSGNISTLQSEMDAVEADLAAHIAATPSNDEINEIETSVGLDSDGGFTANAGGNYISGATSVRGEINALDSQLSNTQSDLETAESTITSLQTTVSGKADSSTVSALQSELDASQAAVGLNANGTYSAHSGSNYMDSALTTKEALSLVDAQTKINEDDITNLETTVATLTQGSGATSAEIAALQGEVDTTQAGAGLSTTGAYVAPGVSNYLSSATSLKGADSLLDTQIKTNADAIALKASASDVSTLTSTVNTNTSDIATNTSDISGNAGDIASLQSDVATAQSDITSLQSSKADDTDLTALEAVVDAHETAVGLSAAGAYQSRSGSNYLDSATSIRGEITLLDAQAKTNADNIASNDSDIADLQSDIASLASSSTITAMQNEIDGIESGVGLNTDGSYTAITGNYATASTLKGAVSQLDTQVKANADAISSNDGDISALDSRLTSDEAALTSLQSEVDAIETGVGLTISGAYQAPASSNYLASSTSVRNALGLLDSQAKTNADAITTEASNRASAISDVDADIATLQSEVNATQSGAGLGTDGSYSANSGANYIDTATSLKDADNKLDAQIKVNADDILDNAADIATNTAAIATKASSSSVSTLQSELDASQAGVGLAANGSYTSPADHNYLGQGTLKADLGALDSQVKTNDDDIATNASDIDSLEALANTHEASIGLSAAGAYVGRSGSNYLDAASSVVAEATLLDAQVKTNADAIATKASSSNVSALQTEVDNVETAVGLDTDGTFISFSGQNYLNSASSLKGGMELLDAAIQARQDNIDSEAATRLSNDNALAAQIDVVEASVGLQSNGSLSITGTNFLNSASSVVSALGILDTNVNFTNQVQTNIKSSAGFSADGTKTAYSSTNYISGSLKAAIEALDAQVKSNTDDITGLGGTDISNLQSELDDTQSGVGLDADGLYVGRSGSNYLDSANTIAQEAGLLDAAVKDNEDAIALKADQTDMDAVEERLDAVEVRGGGIFWDDNSADAVEMDASLLMFKAHIGPWEINLNDLITSNVSDLVFYGEKAPVNGDKNFAVIGDGNVEFVGKYEGYPIP